MSDILQFAQVARPIEHVSAGPCQLDTPLIRTDSVYVVFTTIEETFAAVRVAAELGKAMAVPLTLVHFRGATDVMPVAARPGVSTTETEIFVERLRAEGVDLRARVYLCRDARVIPFAFRRHSLIVAGGRRRWWPTASTCWRRRLEAAGHFVLFVDGPDCRAVRP